MTLARRNNFEIFFLIILTLLLYSAAPALVMSSPSFKKPPPTLFLFDQYIQSTHVEVCMCVCAKLGRTLVIVSEKNKFGTVLFHSDMTIPSLA